MIGRGALACNVARALAAHSSERLVVVISTTGGDDAIDPTSPVCSRELADRLLAIRPATLVLLAFSESPVTPPLPWLADAALADAVTGALDRLVQLGGRAPALLLLTSTAVYGVASGSPLVFDERSPLPRESSFASAAARWAQGLRDVEKQLVVWAVHNGSEVGVLRTASVMGAPGSAGFPAGPPAATTIDSPWAALLRARLPLRVLGYDPPCQVIHYDDLVAAVALAIEQGCGEVLNLVGRSVVPLSRLLAMAGVVAPALPGPLADRIAPAAVDGQRLRWRTLADGRRATALLGFRPQKSLEDCLRAPR